MEKKVRNLASKLFVIVRQRSRVDLGIYTRLLPRSGPFVLIFRKINILQKGLIEVNRALNYRFESIRLASKYRNLLGLGFRDCRRFDFES